MTRPLRFIGIIGCVALVGAGVAGYLLRQDAGTLSPSAAAPGVRNGMPEADTQAARAPLPSGTRPALVAFVDPQASERLPADFHYQVDTVSDPSEVAAVVAVLRDRAEGDTIRHEAANLLRRSAYAELEQVLIDCLQHPEVQERFRSWAVQHLFMVYEERKDADPRAASALLVPLLADPQPAVRREALLSLHRLPLSGADDVPDVVATAAAWLDDPETADLALRILREQDARAYAPQVRALLADDSIADPVRIAAIVTAAAWGDEASRPFIASIAQLPDQPANHRLRRSAQMALERMQ